MKKSIKRLAICLAVVVVATVGALVFTPSKTVAQVNPDCPNGCVPGNLSCQCNGYHPDVNEAPSPEELTIGTE